MTLRCQLEGAGRRRSAGRGARMKAALVARKIIGALPGAVAPGGGVAVAGVGTLGLRAYSRSQEAEADQPAIAILRAAATPDWPLRYTLDHLRRISLPRPGAWLATRPGRDEWIAN